MFFVCCKQQSIDLSAFQPYDSRIIKGAEYSFVLYEDNLSASEEFNIIALKKIDYRDENGVPFFKTIDTVRIKVSPSQVLTTTYCNSWQELYIILGSDALADNFGGVIRAWTINDKHTRIIESRTENLDCLNENSLFD